MGSPSPRDMDHNSDHMNGHYVSVHEGQWVKVCKQIPDTTWERVKWYK